MATDGLIVSTVQGVTTASLRATTVLDSLVIEELGSALYELVDAQACRKIVVEFRGVTFLASQMLGVLVTLDYKARAIKGKVVLCGLQPKLMEVFKITGLDRRLSFAADEAAAMGKFDAAAG